MRSPAMRSVTASWTVPWSRPDQRWSLGVGAEALGLAAEADDLLILLRGAGLLLRHLLDAPLQVVLEVLDLLLFVGDARAPLHFLFFVEPLDVHQLRDLREIGIARGH